MVGHNVSVLFSAVANPDSTTPSDPIRVITERDTLKNGVYYKIDQNIADITYQVTTLT